MAMLVLDAVEQRGNVGAPDVGEDAISPHRQHVNAKHALKLRCGAQLVGLDVALEPLLGDRGDAVRLRWRWFKGREAFPDAPDGVARLVPGGARS